MVSKCEFNGLKNITVHNFVIMFVCVSSSASSLLESGIGMDMLFSVHIWGWPCRRLSRVSLLLTGMYGLSCLSLVVDYIDVFLDVECVSPLLSGSVLEDCWELLLGSLVLQDMGSQGLTLELGCLLPVGLLGSHLWL